MKLKSSKAIYKHKKNKLRYHDDDHLKKSTLIFSESNRSVTDQQTADLSDIIASSQNVTTGASSSDKSSDVDS